MDSLTDWSEKVFGDVELGDVPRTRRLVRMAAEYGRNRSGKIADVYGSGTELQGAYDFIENQHFEANAICLAIAESTVLSCKSTIGYTYQWTAPALSSGTEPIAARTSAQSELIGMGRLDSSSKMRWLLSRMVF